MFKNSPATERREGLEERRPLRRYLIRGLENIGNVDRRVGNYERRFGVLFLLVGIKTRRMYKVAREAVGHL
jgi:hypothetical protein